MSTSYPGGIDSYTAKTDGVDTIVAATINNLQDAVAAIETELGTDPKGAFVSVAAGLAAKVSNFGDTMTGNLDFSGTNLPTNLAAPSGGSDAARKSYVDDRVGTVDFRFRDDFAGDKSPAWTLSGSGGTYVQNQDYSGSGDLSTGATSSNEALLNFNGKGVTDASKAPTAQTRAKLSSTSNVKAVVASLYLDSSNMIEIYYDSSAGANFTYHTESGGTSTTVDSGLAADTSFHVFQMAVASGGGSVVFTIDGGHSQTVSTHIPTGMLEPRFDIVTQAAADKRLTVDYFDLLATR